MSEETFGQVMKRIRVKKGITQSELASRTGLSETAIAFIERGEREPLFRTAIQIADALEVSVRTFHLIRKVTDRNERKTG